jgi:membrane protease YdiL (CAAX protease family)
VFKELIDNFDISVLIPILGLCLFGYWLIKTSLGRRALVDSAPRRNMMPIYFPFLVILFWAFTGKSALFAADKITTEMPENIQVLTRTIALGAVNTVSALGAVVLVRKYFARGLKGFGLNYRKMLKDAFFAVPYLLAVWPVTIAILLLIGEVGKSIYGNDYVIQPHEELVLARSYSELAVRAAILFSGSIVTPFFEEVLFRGLIQTTIRSYTTRPWLSIIVTSVIFAIFHSQEAHWPAIFVIGMLFGYAYEKSGSLFRPIFIHVLFNGLTIIIAMGRS